MKFVCCRDQRNESETLSLQYTEKKAKVPFVLAASVWFLVKPIRVAKANLEISKAVPNFLCQWDTEKRIMQWQRTNKTNLTVNFKDQQNRSHGRRGQSAVLHEKNYWLLFIFLLKRWKNLEGHISWLQPFLFWTVTT